MKKLTIRIISLLLIFVFVLGGCKNNDNKDKDGSNKKVQVHNYVVSETDDYIVKDGKSEYTVVFPSEGTKRFTSSAVSELLTFFEKATGVLLKSSSDVGLTFDDSKKFISIGDTSLVKTAGVEYDVMELGTSGFIIKTVGKSTFIVGDSYGEINGVYGFLQTYFGFKAYAEDEIYIKSGISEQKFLNIVAKDIPDIEHVLNPYADQGMSNNRMHLKTVGDVYAGNRGYVWHNILDGIIPFELYGIDITKNQDYNNNVITQKMKDDVMAHPEYSNHPEWFNHPEWYVMEETRDQDPLGDRNIIEPLQVNLTIARDSSWPKEKAGSVTDEDVKRSQDLLYEVMLYEMKKVLDQTSTREMVFSAEDNGYWSKDEVSTANKAKYGTDTAEYIHCANYLASELQKIYPTFRMTLFAYSGLRDAPTKLVDGKYVPVDESVRLNDNVDIMMCFSKHNRTVDFLDPVENEANVQFEESWAPLLKRRTAWMYGLTYYQDYFVPTSTLMGLGNNYRHLFENDYKLIFDEAQVGKMVSPDWATLKTYIVSQIGWNVYQDMNDLIEEFFTNFFKVAAEPMLEAFNLEQDRLTQLSVDMGDLTNIMSDSNAALKAMINEEAWPENLLLQLLAKFDEAYEAIEVYKDTDPILYETLYNRIKLETLSIRYLRARIYGKYYGAQKTEWMMSIYYDAKGLGIKHQEGQKTLDEYFLNQ